MFAPDTVIDSIQNAKKQLVTAAVPNTAIRDSIVGLIDAQTEIAKQSVKIGTQVMTQISAELVRTMQRSPFDAWLQAPAAKSR
jgi:hypothetical protein